jgi:hypothetical protein
VCGRRVSLRARVELGATGAQKGLVEPACGVEPELTQVDADGDAWSLCVGRALGVNHLRCLPCTSVATCVMPLAHTFSLPPRWQSPISCHRTAPILSSFLLLHLTNPSLQDKRGGEAPT